MWKKLNIGDELKLCVAVAMGWKMIEMEENKMVAGFEGGLEPAKKTTLK